MMKSRTGFARRALPKDPLFRLLAVNGLAGTVVAGLVLGGIFLANIGNLRVLVSSAEDPVLPIAMLAFALVITLGSVVIGSAIMLLGENRGDGGKGHKNRPLPLQGRLAPIAVTAPARHHHMRNR